MIEAKSNKGGNMATAHEVRKAVKAAFPDLTFKVKTIDFTDLARDKAVFVSSDAWGMTKDNHKVFQAVQAVACPLGAIVEW